MLIDTDNPNPDLAGEILRDFCFKDDKYYPCNDNISAGFLIPSNENQEKLHDIFRDWLPMSENDDLYDCPVYYFSYIPMTGERIDVIFWNDGDYTLIIKDGNFAYINRDAKKSHGWSRVKV